MIMTMAANGGRATITTMNITVGSALIIRLLPGIMRLRRSMSQARRKL